jgi:hypothetical protein
VENRRPGMRRQQGSKFRGLDQSKVRRQRYQRNGEN